MQWSKQLSFPADWDSSVVSPAPIDGDDLPPSTARKVVHESRPGGPVQPRLSHVSRAVLSLAPSWARSWRSSR